MGLTHIKASIANPARPKTAIDVTFLVDSGAVYSVIPAPDEARTAALAHAPRLALPFTKIAGPSVCLQSRPAVIVVTPYTLVPRP